MEKGALTKKVLLSAALIVVAFFIVIALVKILLSPSGYIGNWSGKTEQDIPITLKIENVDGKIMVTQVEYNIVIKTQYGRATKSTVKPEAISAEVIDSAFSYETSQFDVVFTGISGRFGFMATVTITGKFTSGSLLKGSIQTIHIDPNVNFRANSATYTAKKQEKET